MSSAPHTLEIVVPRLRELAQVGIPSLSQAADAALLVHNAVKVFPDTHPFNKTTNISLSES